MDSKYKRILIKFSGEQLAGAYGSGIDPNVANYLAQEIKKAQDIGTEIIVIVGGGNMVRGTKVAGNGIRRVTADQMGMLSGLINSISLTDIFESKNIKTRCLSNIYAEQVAESYSYRRALKHLENGRVILIAGGVGRPYFTHDTAAISMALELDCEVVIKATKVDGVFDKDPEKFPDAVKLNNVTFDEAVTNQSIKVMDKAALALAMEYQIPVIIYDSMQEDGIINIVNKQPIGTIVTN